MTFPKKGRRSITVDDDDFHWVVQFERSGHVVIQHSSGKGACVIVEPLDIMQPTHIADAIRFAIKTGWKPSIAGPNFWMGFALDADSPRYIQVAPNSEIHHNDELNRWMLPDALDADTTVR